MEKLTETAGRVLTGLPASFLCLILLNVVFVGVVFWFEAAENVARTELITHLMDSCRR